MARKIKTNALKVLPWMLVLMFGMFGGMKLMGPAEMVENFARWGYPAWFIYAIGAVELAGAVGLAWSRTRFYAAAGLSLIMIGAAATPLSAGEYGPTMMPLMFLALTAVQAWNSRPATTSTRNHDSREMTAIS